MSDESIYVSDDEMEKRMAICVACDKYNTDKKRCSHQKCGCFVKLKTKLATEKCPINLW